MARPIADYHRHVLELAIHARPQPVSVDLREACAFRRFLAGDVQAAAAVPPFDNSAVDGFALNRSDLTGEGPWTFDVAGDVPAGARALEVPAGKAIRIMTGAPVTGSDVCVIPVEDTDAQMTPTPPPTVTVRAFNPQRPHVRHRGEHIRPGDRVARHGTELSAPTRAALLSAGLSSAQGFPVLGISVITTGDEVGSAIPNSNGPMAASTLATLGRVSQHHCRDDVDTLRELLDARAATDQLIVTVGGISAGAFDVVKATAREHAWFGHVAMHPGKPQGTGQWNGTPLICLPGNPIAAWVGLQLFVVPAAEALSGGEGSWQRLDIPVAEGAPAPRTGSEVATPARLDPQTGTAIAHPGGSHMVGALAGADALILTHPDGSREVLRARV